MKYVGSKARIAKDILPIMLKDRKDNQYFVDLFCGGCNLIDKVTGLRIANDIQPELIALYKALQEGWLPPTEISEKEYKLIKYRDVDTMEKYGKHYLAVRAFVGFGCSFGGKYFSGYSRGNATNGSPRNYIIEAYNNVMKQVPYLKGIEFTNLSYEQVALPPNSIIYCDIPYKNTTKYAISNFDDTHFYNSFYTWCRKTAEHHTIFISEYEMPDDFECLYERQICSSLTKDTGAKKAKERLFTIRKQ